MLLEISHPLELFKLTAWLDSMLRSLMPDWGALLIEFVLIGLVLLLAYAVIALALIYIERKITAFFQCRLGPNRVGKYGIIQSVADMVKILLKEIIPIDHVDKILFYLAPFFVIVSFVPVWAEVLAAFHVDFWGFAFR